MPYTVSKNDEGEFCVYKADAEGEPMGETLGCHATAEEAGAQIGAIERAEETKAEASFDEQARVVRDAFYAAFPNPNLVAEVANDCYVRDIYPDHVIVELGPHMFRVSLSITEGGVQFAPRDEWTEVEQQYVAKAVKLAAETEDYFEIEGLAVPYIGPFEGNKDFDGEKFTPETDLCLDWFPNGRPFLYDHGWDEDVGLEAVGREVKNWDSDVGRWATVQIDKSKKYWEKIKELVEAGKLFFSSGALARFISKDKDGNIVCWPWVELTGTPTPANPYAVTMPAAQKNYKSSGLEFTIPDEGEAEGGQDSARAEPDAGEGETSKTSEVKLTMEEVKLQELVAKATAEAVAGAFKAREDAEADSKAKAEADAKAKAEEEARVKAAVQAELETRLADSKIVHDTSGKSSGIKVLSRYDSLAPEELDLLAMIQGKSPGGWSEQLRNALKAKFNDKGEVYTAGAEDSDSAAKAIALMDTTDTSNWVPTVMRAELWRKLRLENKIVSLFQNIDMPSETYDIPTESTSPTVYKVAEQTAGTPTLSTGITTSQAADTKLSLGSSKFGAAVWFSGEMDEASAFPLLPMIRSQLGDEMGNAAEYIIVNGDTTTGATNISVATPGATDKVLCDDGLRHQCLVTATGQGRSAGALTFDDLTATRKLLGKYGVQISDLAWLCDIDTYLSAIIGIDEFITMDKYGAGATVLTGEVGKMQGIPVIVSENIYKTGTNGQVISAGTTGNLLVVARSQWIVGWRRHPRFGVNYYDNVDSTRVTVLARMGFGGFDEGASTQTVALSYNITV